MKALFKLAIFILAANAMFRIVPPYWNHNQFEDEVERTSVNWREFSDEQVRELVLSMAKGRDLPLKREEITVSRERDHLFVNLAYTRRMQLVPGTTYDWNFKSNIDTWMLT